MALAKESGERAQLLGDSAAGLDRLASEPPSLSPSRSLFPWHHLYRSRSSGGQLDFTREDNEAAPPQLRGRRWIEELT